jgi:hypothetical protein
LYEKSKGPCDGSFYLYKILYFILLKYKLEKLKGYQVVGETLSPGLSVRAFVKRIAFVL